MWPALVYTKNNFYTLCIVYNTSHVFFLNIIAADSLIWRSCEFDIVFLHVGLLGYY